MKCPICEAGIPLKKGKYFYLEKDNSIDKGYIFINDDKIKEIENKFKIILKDKNIKLFLMNPPAI